MLQKNGGFKVWSNVMHEVAKAKRRRRRLQRPNVGRGRLQKAKCRVREAAEGQTSCTRFEMTEPFCTMLQKAEPARLRLEVLGDDCWPDAGSGWPHGWSCGGGVAGSCG
ncbi:hypothetical protein AXF42_Ash018279 [Apostasia shenzhenica]|uniref:Uncharacterized protein n=1 Tax=Apostasia shenzhenica TaxID=1088818 RepID=A0A2I0B2P5_9ASPA|nr:hypothetical protein AXF42_Ash018279 [Apostasia shenzhenica]